MANGLYQTEGIILNSADQGEADKVITVFTKDFGMLKLFARGTRRPSSKLNKFLNIFSHGRFGFVSGKDSWHLVDAQDLGGFSSVLEPEFAKATGFLERFCPGEGSEAGLWEVFMEFDRSRDELLFYSKALATLGYLEEEENKDGSRENLSRLVNEAIARSQL